MTKLSLNELLAQKAALDLQIAETQRSERADAVAQVRALMAQYGLTAADVVGKAPTAGKRLGGKKVPAK